MSTRSGRLGELAALVAAGLIALSAGAGSIGAAEPSVDPAEPPPSGEPTTGPGEPPVIDGVVHDAAVTVAFSADEAAFDLAAGGPLPGATVLVTAVADGEYAGEWSAETDPDGIARLDGVARADVDGPEVSLDIVAQWLRRVERDDGCVDIEAFSAEAVVTSDATVDVELSGTPTTGVECPEPSPTPVAGVAWDASLEVAFTDADGLPIGGADVTLIATRGEADGDGSVGAPDGTGGISGESFFKAAGTTADDGTVTLADLPRALDEPDALPVAWTVQAFAFPFEDVDGCQLGRELRADATIEDPVAGSQAVELVAGAADPEWGDCDEPGDDAPMVTITAVGPDGIAVEEGLAHLTQTRHDGATWEAYKLSLIDGTLDAQVQAWGDAAEPSTLTIAVEGPFVREETEGDCTFRVLLDGELALEAAFATDPPTAVTVELAEERSAGICGDASLAPGSGTDDSTDMPAEGNGPGSAELTPPPTDRAAMLAPDERPVDGVVAWLLGAAGLVAFVGFLGRRRLQARTLDR